MKTRMQIVLMQDNLRLAMMSMQASGAPPEVVNQAAVALASADDTINWVLERPSTLAKLEEEYNQKRNEQQHPTRLPNS